MQNGKIIVIEGSCDGVGKTTQYNMLYQHLLNDNITVANHHFPTYGTYQGAPVEKYLQGQMGQLTELSPYFINSLYALDRAITWHTNLKYLYEQGQTILLDRYTTSSLIYQAALIKDPKLRKDFIDYIVDFEYSKLGIKQPDNVIFLSAPFDLITIIRNQRKENEGISNDIHESNLDFMKEVYKCALFVADYLSWDKIICNNGNEMRSKEDIHNDIYQLLKKP